MLASDMTSEERATPSRGGAVALSRHARAMAQPVARKLAPALAAGAVATGAKGVAKGEAASAHAPAKTKQPVLAEASEKLVEAFALLGISAESPTRVRALRAFADAVAPSASVLTTEADAAWARETCFGVIDKPHVPSTPPRTKSLDSDEFHTPTGSPTTTSPTAWTSPIALPEDSAARSPVAARSAPPSPVAVSADAAPPSPSEAASSAVSSPSAVPSSPEVVVRNVRRPAAGRVIESDAESDAAEATAVSPPADSPAIAVRPVRRTGAAVKIVDSDADDEIHAAPVSNRDPASTAPPMPAAASARKIVIDDDSDGGADEVVVLSSPEVMVRSVRRAGAPPVILDSDSDDDEVEGCAPPRPAPSNTRADADALTAATNVPARVRRSRKPSEAVSHFLDLEADGASERSSDEATDEGENDGYESSFIDDNDEDDWSPSKSASEGDSSEGPSPPRWRMSPDARPTKRGAPSDNRRGVSSVPVPPPPEPVLTGAAFHARRASLTKEWYRVLNAAAFGGALPADLEIEWSNSLLRTAGTTTMFVKLARRVATVQLSEKVLTDEGRLQQTLAHELCHAAAWIVDGVAKPPHGVVFRKWARRVESNALAVRTAAKESGLRPWDAGMNVETCHSYEIMYKYRWQCISCEKVYGRHSKSIDVNTALCGCCGSGLRALGTFKADGTPSRAPVSRRRP